MITESLTVLVYVVSGALLARSGGARGLLSTVVLGFFLGVAGVQLVMLVQIATPLPTTPLIALVVTPLGALAVWMRARRREGYTPILWWQWAVISAGVVAAVAFFRSADLVKWHSDTADYLFELRVLLDGHFYQSLDPELLAKRPPGVASLHSGAILQGEYYLRSITPLLAIATLGAIVVYLRRGLPRLRPGQAFVFAGLGAALLATGNRPVHHAFYLNGHLLTGAMVLVMAASLWILAQGRAHDSTVHLMLACGAAATIILTRAEGPLTALVVLLPALLTPGIELAMRRFIAVWVGAVIAVWNVFSSWLAVHNGVEPAMSNLAQIGLGSAVAAAGWLLLGRTVVESRPSHWLRLAEWGLWVSFALLFALQPLVILKSGYATWINQTGSGAWGLTLWIVGLLVILVMLALHLPGSHILRFPVATWIPFIFILAVLREGAYRVGMLDSLNRMWMQVLPIAVFYATVMLAAGQWRLRWPHAWRRGTGPDAHGDGLPGEDAPRRRLAPGEAAL